MSTATVMLRLRARPRLGPALGRTQLPVASIILSAVFHGGLVAAFVLAAELWPPQESKIYVINLVPAVAAVGQPDARRTQSPTPQAPRPPDPAPPAERPTPAPELPARPPELPARPAELPARSAALPDRDLPARTLPPREAAAPRPSEKELPPITGAVAKASPSPAPIPTAQRQVPQPQAGRPNGSPQGSGAVTIDVDFPYAWYIQAVHRKVSQNWDGQAREGTQPVIMFEIERNGQVGRVSVEKTSGNAVYDQVAVRAIQNSTPFPELPADFKAPLIRVHLSFGFAPRQG
jgi:protein TonB